jgi:PAS domain S-box-containing protein
MAYFEHGVSPSLQQPTYGAQMTENEDRNDEILSFYLKSLLDTLSDGVYITDQKGMTLHVNTMYENLTGLKREDIVGHNVRDLKEQGVFNIILNPEVVKTGKPVTQVQTNMHDRRLVLSGYPIFDSTGKVAMVVTYARDITIISNMKDQIEQQQELIEKYHTNLDYLNRQKIKKAPLVIISKEMSQVLATLRLVASTDITVLLLGETGVGKDVLARHIHERSTRSTQPFFKVDCSSIPESLIESELFGYAPGAFSGALTKGKLGFFEMADKGTLFLDEIGELPYNMQSRLLRVLQDQEIVRLGSTQPRKVDVRIVAATNRDLTEEVKSGRFRSDLYYRLRVSVVTIPPLRERMEDILPLARHFLEKFSNRYRKIKSFSPMVEKTMLEYHWPGNIRELENLVLSLVITCERNLIERNDLPTSMVNECSEDKVPSVEYERLFTSPGKSLKEIMSGIERDIIHEALNSQGSVSKVAKMFKVNRTTIFRKLQLTEITPPQGKDKRKK